MLTDLVCSAYFIARLVMCWLDMYMSVYINMTNQSGCIINNMFIVLDTYRNFQQRAVAWLYRWHDPLDIYDWNKLSAQFHLGDLPAHRLMFIDRNEILQVSFNQPEKTYTLQVEGKPAKVFPLTLTTSLAASKFFEFVKQSRTAMPVD